MRNTTTRYQKQQTCVLRHHDQQHIMGRIKVNENATEVQTGNKECRCKTANFKAECLLSCVGPSTNTLPRRRESLLCVLSCASVVRDP